MDADERWTAGEHERFIFEMVGQLWSHIHNDDIWLHQVDTDTPDGSVTVTFRFKSKDNKNKVE